MEKKTSPIELRRLRDALKVISCIPELENLPPNQDLPWFELRLAAYLPK